jgi:hypothetical protein
MSVAQVQRSWPSRQTQTRVSGPIIAAPFTRRPRSGSSHGQVGNNGGAGVGEGGSWWMGALVSLVEARPACG